ncbi:hypothetical protein PMAYCL1PPCAC_08271 [Pristionchus mayeri]|uniref:Uncharacterized protein n=1 Tax=Pristionchus mayeri TaxID=1317129 RepID=A0AAN5CDX1_9BILA|nr:hypothetical protein PMAYCL1PPCAC_08271 [Pristionchus mayeri]
MEPKKTEKEVQQMKQQLESMREDHERQIRQLQTTIFSMRKREKELQTQIERKYQDLKNGQGK